MYAREYQRISNEKISIATGSKLLINIINIRYNYIKIINKYMKNSKFVFDRITKLFEQGLVSSRDLANELMTILKSKRDEIVFKMKLTSKDEFEVLSKRVENLEKKLVKLQPQKKKKTKRAKKS